VRRSNLMVLLGVAFFVLGGAIVLLVLKDSGSGSAEASPGRLGRVLVVVATEPVAAGALGDDLIASGTLETREVAAEQRPADAITSPSELSGRIFQTAFAEGEPLRAGGLRASSLRQGSGVEIPEGMEAVAVQVGFVSGAAGYVGPGDRVNLWAVIEKTGPLDESNQPTGPGFRTPRTELLLSNVEVLDVSSEVAPRRANEDPNAPRPSGDSLTYLLAVDATAASRAIFATSFHDLYLTLVREGAQPVTVPGVEHGNLIR
jgi:Flp pilus assembly protein CpaB